jgi:hypothetical protein
MKVVNLFGGPCSGKSAIAAGIFSEMKARHLNAELVTEYAKDLVYSETLNVLKNNQEFIFAEQSRRQRILNGKVDWAITDSPLLLSMHYGRANNFANESFLNHVSDSFRQYENFNFFIERPDVFQQEGRDHNHEQSLEIDQALKNILKEEGYEHTVVKCDKHTIGKILGYLHL